MSNKIMLSIHRIHAERIFSGEKTLEIRKTVPSGTPFIAYMYETKSGGGAGAVVGQFKCRTIIKTNAFGTVTFDEFDEEVPYWHDSTLFEGQEYREYISERACLTLDELTEYANGGDIHALEISEVIRYPAAMPLSFFGINRAPQSWQYVK